MAILGRIDDHGLVVTLVCDFAERVCDLSPDPTKARECLRVARDEKGARTMARATARAEAMSKAAGKAGAAPGEQWAIEAVKLAMFAAGGGETWITARAAEAVLNALKQTSQIEADIEYNWQLAHTRELACSCVEPVIVVSGTRSRNSLLAQ